MRKLKTKVLREVREYFKEERNKLKHRRKSEVEKLKIDNKEFQDILGKRKSPLRPFHSCVDRNKWNLLAISGGSSKEESDPKLSEWGHQNPMDQEDKEDSEEDYDTLPETVFLT